MSRVALKLVQSPSHQQREVQLWPKENDESGHSLHYLVSYPNNFPWSFPNYFIQKYSQKGELVLDPFCSTGATLLEAALLGRVAYGADLDPMAARISNAKLHPCDITEVTLSVQQLNLSRPVNLDGFKEAFSAFYSVETFRELVNLRAAIQREPHSPVAAYVEALTLSLLHGHSASYFSTYSYPQIALSPAEQNDLNIKRGQFPDYRAITPRLLRRAAIVSSDGVPVALRLKPSPHKVSVADARNLSHVETSSVSLTVTSVPYPGMRDLRPEQWLKFWFAGIPQQEAGQYSFYNLEEWLDFMNEALLEMARVTRAGGRAVLDTRILSYNGQSIYLDRELIDLIDRHLDRYWSCELTLMQSADAFTSVGTTRASSSQGRDYRVLVLRRK